MNLKDNLTRRGIHMKPTEYEPSYDECDEYDENEEEDEREFQSRCNETKLYPDLKNELKEIENNFENELKEIKYNFKKNVKHDRNTSKKLTGNNGNTVMKISNKNKDQGEKSHKGCAFLIICVIAIAGVVLALFFSNIQKNVEIRNVTQLIENLENKFHNQPKWTYKILSSALKKVVHDTSEPEPSAPAIITVLANQDAAETAKNFCTHLAELLVSRKYVMIDGRVYEKKDENEIKEEIDEEIRSKVESSSLNVVVVDQVEKIPINATMIFHNFCDHDNADFKRVVYMFVLSLKKDLNPDAGPKQLDYAAMEHYRKTWQHAHPDDIESLITRLTVDVINISFV